MKILIFSSKCSFYISFYCLTQLLYHIGLSADLFTSLFKIVQEERLIHTIIRCIIIVIQILCSGFAVNPHTVIECLLILISWKHIFLIIIDQGTGVIKRIVELPVLAAVSNK